jgi:hypothetical protein
MAFRTKGEQTMKRFSNLLVRYLVYLLCGLGLLLVGSTTPVLADSPEMDALYETAQKALAAEDYVTAAMYLAAYIEMGPDILQQEVEFSKGVLGTWNSVEDVTIGCFRLRCSDQVPVPEVTGRYLTPPRPSLPPFPTSLGTASTTSPGTTSTTACSGPPVITSFTAYPTTIGKGQSSVLQWGSVTNAQGAYLMAEDTITGVATPAQHIVTPSQTTSYTLVAFCDGKAVRSDVTVQVRSSTAFAEPAFVSILEGDAQVPDGTPVVLYSGWITDAPEQQEDFLASLNMVLTVDGKPLPTPMAFWGEIEEYGDADQDGDMDFVIWWRYPLDVLSRETHPVVVEWSYQRPITDGFDSDGDGARDEFYEPREFSLGIVVGGTG